jgi:hypothetical protein
VTAVADLTTLTAALATVGHDTETARAARKVIDEEKKKVPLYSKGPVGLGERPLIPEKRHVQ